MAIQEVLSAPRPPWQRAYVERAIGTIRRECLDHLIAEIRSTLDVLGVSILLIISSIGLGPDIAKKTPMRGWGFRSVRMVI